MIVPVLCFILAEVAAYLTFQFYQSSPLSLIVPYPIEIILFILPVFGLVFRKPFSYYLYNVMIAFSIAGILSNSEMFYSFLDALYYLGLRELARYVYSLLVTFKADVLHFLTITWLYVSSELLVNADREIEKLKREEVEVKGVFAYYLSIFAMSAAIYFLYPMLLTPLSTKPGMLLALLAVIAFLTSVYLAIRRAT